MELQEGKVSVWVCQEEKLVLGLSHRTTCSDVVRALLADSQRRGQPQPQSPGAMLRGPASAYCVVEKWRGAERRLPGRTRLLRLWAAWGAERDNVRFVLVRRGASLPGAGPRSAEARVVPSRDWDGDRDGTGPGSGARQRRAVRKAFRKLAAIQRRQQQQLLEPQPQPQPEPAAQERMETLVHLVLSQDQTLRQQGQRLRELDRHIEGYEARTHLARVRRHGANYVQDTYLAGPAEQGQEREQQQEEEEEEERGQEEEEAAALVLALAERGEALRGLQERRERLEARLERLGAELQRELNERWMRRRRRELEAAGCSLPEPERCTTELSGCWADGEGEEAAWERDRLKTQLSASLYIGLRLGADLEAVRGALEAARQDAEARRRELQHLRDALAALAVADGWEEPEPKLWVPKGCEDKDEDSDTGLSSMHSQDSDCLPACESLV